MEDIPDDYGFEYDDEVDQQQSSKKGIPRKVPINIKDALSAKKLMQKILDVQFYESGWHETLSDTKWEFKYIGSETHSSDQLYEFLAKKGKVINRYPNIRHLSTKSEFQKLVAMATEMNTAVDEKKLLNFIPKTYIFPDDKDRFAKSKPGLFIAKPSSGGMGDSIYVFKDLKTVPERVQEDMVVQRYIDKPFLMDGLKFDLRLYVVLTGIEDGNVHAFLADEGLARFCTEPYVKVTPANFRNQYMHLTNYSINKISKTYISDKDVENVLEPNNASKRTLAALFKQIEQEHGAEACMTIRQNIFEVCSATMHMLFPRLVLNANPENPRSEKKRPINGKVFQILGLDVLIDKDLKAWLLEINDHPSLNIQSCTQFMGCNHKNCHISEVDTHVKKRVLTDAIKLMFKSRKNDLATSELFQAEFRNLTRIFPAPVDSLEQMTESLYAMKNFFLTLAGSKPMVSSNDFERVVKDCAVITAAGLKRVDLNLIFMKGSKNQKLCDLFGLYGVLCALGASLEQKTGTARSVVELIECLN